MIRQNGGGSGGSGGGVQHLTAIGQSDETLFVPGFQGSIDDVAVIVVSQSVNLMAAPAEFEVSYEIIDLLNKHALVYSTTYGASFNAHQSCDVLDGTLTITNTRDKLWKSTTYDVTIYMK